MSPLRIIKCPQCGARHYIGHPCRRAGDSTHQPKFSFGRAIAIVAVFLVALIVLVSVSMIVADVKGRGFGIAVALGSFLLMHLVRLGHEWDDGVDFWTLMLPAPWDWGEKFNRLINFWTMPRPFFRAMYLASAVGLFIVVAVLLGGNAVVK